MTLPELARISVETYLKEGRVFENFSGLPKEFLEKKAGVFVSIFNNETEFRYIKPSVCYGKSLRGCIGTYLPARENIAREVVLNAIAASTEDYRFLSIGKEDLPFLSFTVYVLGKPKPTKDYQELNPKKYGIIVKSGRKTGLLLPDLEGVDTVEKQIFIACQKAGINSESEAIVIYRFAAEKYE